jgi:hypothetical protein
MKQKVLQFDVEVETSQIAYELTSKLDHESLQDFVMTLDEEAASWDFSVGLVNKLLRSFSSNFIVVADEQKKNGEIAIQIDKREIPHASIRESTGVVEFIHD